MDTTREAKDTAANALKNGADKAKDVARSASERVRDMARNYDWNSIEQSAEDLLVQPTRFVRRHPLSTVVGALAVGYLIGAMRSTNR